MNHIARPILALLLATSCGGVATAKDAIPAQPLQPAPSQPVTSPATTPAPTPAVEPGEVDVGLEDLSWFLVGDRASLLLRYFERRHEWIVEVGDGPLATTSVRRKDEPFVSWSFGAIPLAPDRNGKPPRFTSAKPGSGKVSVHRNAMPSPIDDGKVSSFLYVRDGFIMLSTADLSADKSLPGIRKALEDAEQLLKTVRTAIEAAPPGRSATAEYNLDMLPRPPQRIGEPSMSVTGTSGGSQGLEAWINPGERGTVFVAAVDAVTRQPIPLFRDYAQRRRIPWSSEADWLTCVQLHAALMPASAQPSADAPPPAAPSRPTKPAPRDVIFQFRFTPDDPGKPERTLIEKRVTIG